MFKIIISLCVLLMVASTSNGWDQPKSDFDDVVVKGAPMVGSQPKIAFDYFEKYLAKHDVSDDRGALEAAKSFKEDSSIFVKESLLVRAAKIYVYLNEFKQCDPIAIEYIYGVLRGRKYAEPGSVAMEGDTERPKTRLEKLLEDTLVRAGDKCSSYIPKWLSQSQDSLSSSTKQMVEQLLSDEVIRTKSYNRVGEMFARRVVKEGGMTTDKQLSKSNKKTLGRYFETLIIEEFVKPCKEYVRVMSPLMSRIEFISFVSSPLMKSLSDGPSRDLLDSRSRFQTCEYFLKHGSSFSQEAARIAALTYRPE